jgi:hypothetical protein
MNFIDVRLFEFIPDAQAFIHLSVTLDLPIGDPRITEVGKRGREASILQGNSIGRTRIFGDLSKFEYDKIVLEIRENLGTDKTLNYEPLFLWLEREFPNLVASSVDKTMRSIDGGPSFIKRTHTVILREVDALKFRLMFSCSSA